MTVLSLSDCLVSRKGALAFYYYINISIGIFLAKWYTMINLEKYTHHHYL